MAAKIKVSIKSDLVLRKLSDLKKPASKGAGFIVGILNNPEVATYAAYNEFGWVQHVTAKQQWWFRGQRVKNPPKEGNTLMSPPRPFLRATAAAKKDEWRKAVEEGISALGVQNIPQVMELVARQAQVDVQETIRNGGTDQQKFPERSPLTLELYQAKDAKTSKGSKRKIEGDSGSARKQALFRSGKLLQSIGYEILKG